MCYGLCVRGYAVVGFGREVYVFAAEAGESIFDAGERVTSVAVGD